MSKIQVLDEQTIDKIAAGEVVERPSSVVKELVENAVDARATAITIEIKDGGISLIRITDNGEGIPKEQVASAFLRHATSKITSAEDLLTVSSLGFRGEALSSIAAVAQVELITKTASELTGTKYVIEGSKEKSIEDIGAPQGTTFLVRNLFYNTPARQKFLKSAQTEASYIATLAERLALSHPDISFQVIVNNQPRLHTNGNTRIKDIIYHIFGRDIAAGTVPVQEKKELLSVEGFIGKPFISRGNRNFEIYFINGRYIKSTLITKCIEDAYKPFMMKHQYPFTVLQISIDSDLIDVNVHPAKMEIRFCQSESVYRELTDILQAALKHQDMIQDVSADKETKKKKPDTRPVSRRPEPFEKKRLEALSAALKSDSPYERKYAKPPAAENAEQKGLAASDSKLRDAAVSDSCAEKQMSGGVPSAFLNNPGQDIILNTGSHSVSGGHLKTAGNSDTGSHLNMDSHLDEGSLLETASNLNTGSYLKTASRSDTGGLLDAASRSDTGGFSDAASCSDTGGLSDAASLSDTGGHLAADSYAATGSYPDMRGYAVNGKDTAADSQTSASSDSDMETQPHTEASAACKDSCSTGTYKYEQLSIAETEFYHTDFIKEAKRRNYTVIGQIFDTYWLVQAENELFLIDQHAAHEKVLYERMMNQLKKQEFTSQQISPPIIITMTMQEQELFHKYEEQFSQIGFEINAFGGREYALCAVPDNLYGLDPRELFLEMLDGLNHDTRRQTPDMILEKIASMSCKAAVKGKQRLSEQEARSLLSDLLELENPYHCPHGRPVIIAMSKTEIERKFKRIV